MTTLKINIEANNAAFDEPDRGRELARIVHSVADDLVFHGTITRKTLWDIDGNAVGEAELLDDTDDGYRSDLVVPAPQAD